MLLHSVVLLAIQSCAVRTSPCQISKILQRRLNHIKTVEMPCTTLVDMCAECSKQYAGIRQRTLDHSIAIQPGIYPVAFRAQFSKYEVPFEYVLSLAERTQETLYQIFGHDIPVIGCSSIPDCQADDRVWVSILIEFPAEDKEIITKMFGGYTGFVEGWECLMPRGCPSAFYLEWHKDPVALGIEV